MEEEGQKLTILLSKKTTKGDHKIGKTGQHRLWTAPFPNYPKISYLFQNKDKTLSVHMAHHYLGISYHVSILGRLGSNGFQLN